MKSIMNSEQETSSISRTLNLAYLYCDFLPPPHQHAVTIARVAYSLEI